MLAIFGEWISGVPGARRRVGREQLELLIFRRTPARGCGTLLRHHARCGPGTHTSRGRFHAMREMAPNPIRLALPHVLRYEQITPLEIQFKRSNAGRGQEHYFGDMKGTLKIRPELFARVFDSPAPVVLPFTSVG